MSALEPYLAKRKKRNRSGRKVKAYEKGEVEELVEV